MRLRSRSARNGANTGPVQTHMASARKPTSRAMHPTTPKSMATAPSVFVAPNTVVSAEGIATPAVLPHAAEGMLAIPSPSSRQSCLCHTGGLPWQRSIRASGERRRRLSLPPMPRPTRQRAGSNTLRPHYPPGKALSPPGRLLFPPGPPSSPLGRLFSPPGRLISPPGNEPSPPGKPASPLGRPTFPDGRATLPPEQPSLPPGRLTLPPGRLTLPPGQPTFPPGRATRPTGRPTFPGGRLLFPLGKPRFPGGRRLATTARACRPPRPGRPPPTRTVR